MNCHFIRGNLDTEHSEQGEYNARQKITFCEDGAEWGSQQHGQNTKLFPSLEWKHGSANTVSSVSTLQNREINFCCFKFSSF